jgi:hypothetical protein
MLEYWKVYRSRLAFASACLSKSASQSESMLE